MKQFLILPLALSLSLYGCESLKLPEKPVLARQSNSHLNEQLLQSEMRPSQGGIVFYRDATARDNQAVNIALNSTYLVSLLPDVSTRLAVCAKPLQVVGYYPLADEAFHTEKELNLKAGEIVFIKVETSDSQMPTLRIVDKSTALTEMVRLGHRPHTLSRVTHIPCKQPAPPTKDQPPEKLSALRLDASALFAYNSASLEDMPEAGEKAIKILTQDILAQKDQLTGIVITGHTDPKGNKAYNQKLSEKRAKAVRDVLIEKGVAKALIRVEGMGESQLLIKDCAEKFSDNVEEEKRCNQPNRRIEVALFGKQTTPQKLKKSMDELQ